MHTILYTVENLPVLLLSDRKHEYNRPSGCDLIVILTFIFLMTEYLFKCLLDICISFLEKYVFKSYAHFKISFLLYFIVEL